MSRKSKAFKGYLFGCFVFYISFCIFWILLYFLLSISDNTVFSKETLLAIGVVIFLVVGGSVLFRYLWGMIIELKGETEKTIGMYTVGGKYIIVTRGEIIYIEEQSNHFLILLRDGRKYRVIRNGLRILNHIDNQVREICTSYGIPIYPQ